jgi:hypothetical protein
VIGGTKPGRRVCARAGYRLAERSEGARLAGSGSNAVTGGAGVIVIAQSTGMTSKSVPKIVPMFQTGTRTTKQRRGFAPVR